MLHRKYFMLTNRAPLILICQIIIAQANVNVNQVTVAIYWNKYGVENFPHVTHVEFCSFRSFTRSSCTYCNDGCLVTLGMRRDSRSDAHTCKLEQQRISLVCARCTCNFSLQRAKYSTCRRCTRCPRSFPRTFCTWGTSATCSAARPSSATGHSCSAHPC